ncbi:transcriptional adapter 3-A-like isoform X2 [Halichondria panicea]|uniref:transcriptional adapter 3-A-like isoform X2 n=1 Tax=Halichondria panicea TaxID=6063 RepID=UPI00312B9808
MRANFVRAASKMDSSPIEYQPCPLQFYEFQQLDTALDCPIFTDILAHQDRPINVDSISSLQSELIALQGSAQSRISLLEAEVAALETWQVKRDYRKRKHSDGDSRSQRSDTPLKKLKVEEVSKTKKIKSKKSQNDFPTPSDPVKVKGDAPDRFWASVEPYCADLTETDLKLLQEGIRNENDDAYSVPPLGVHYSRQWASHDIHSEREVSARLGQLADPFTERGGEWEDESDHMLNQADSAKDKPQYGPLTERLIAAFLEDSNGQNRGTTGQVRMNTPPSAVTVDTLENRIKHELIALGLFNIEDELREADEGEDEILAELRKNQDELNTISEYNLSQRQTLYKLAKQEMKRQELRQAAKEADEEVITWLGRITSLKQKRKGALTRKEKESAWRALQQREEIQRKINHKL